MADNRFYGMVAGISQFAGLGTIVYGIINHDIEIIIGGTALAYTGKRMFEVEQDAKNSLLEIEKIMIEKERNEILKNKSIDDKFPC